MSVDNDIFEGKWITSRNGFSMYTRIARNASLAPTSAMVLVHGLAVSSRYMLPTAARLPSDYSVYVPDLPVFGRSVKPAHILNISELADALIGWMGAIGLSSATFLGNSMGCQVIVNAALRYPGRVRQAILVGPTMDPQARTMHRAGARLVLDGVREPIHFLPVLVQEYGDAGMRRTIGTLQHAFADRIEEHLPLVRIPTLVVRGSRDPLVSQRWVEQVHHLLPNSQLAVVQGAAHAVNYNSPQELTHITRRFLSKLRH